MKPLFKFFFPMTATLIVVSLTFPLHGATGHSVRISAGSKKIELKSSANMRWSNFCSNSRMGCARLKLSENNKHRFGMIKVLAIDFKAANVASYCRALQTEVENSKIRSTMPVLAGESCFFNSVNASQLVKVKDGVLLMASIDPLPNQNPTTRFANLTSLIEGVQVYEP